MFFIATGPAAPSGKDLRKDAVVAQFGALARAAFFGVSWTCQRNSAVRYFRVPRRNKLEDRSCSEDKLVQGCGIRRLSVFPGPKPNLKKRNIRPSGTGVRIVGLSKMQRLVFHTIREGLTIRNDLPRSFCDLIQWPVTEGVVPYLSVEAAVLGADDLRPWILSALRSGITFPRTR